MPWPGVFSDIVTPDIGFIDKALGQCYALVVKILFSVLLIYKWSQVNFDLNTCGALSTLSGPSFVSSFTFLRRWSI